MWARWGREEEGWRYGREGSCWVGAERRSVEQKQQMDWGAAERGAGRQPLFWLLPLCRRFCCLSARLTRYVCPPARLHGVSVLGSTLMFSSLLKLCSLLLITTILSFSSPCVPPPAERAQHPDADHLPSPSLPCLPTAQMWWHVPSLRDVWWYLPTRTPTQLQAHSAQPWFHAICNNVSTTKLDRPSPKRSFYMKCAC